MNYPYAYLIVFSILLYLILTDESIAKAFYLICQIVRIKYERFKWWIRYCPDNPIVKYLIWRRSYQIAKQLQEEFDKKSKEN